MLGAFDVATAPKPFDLSGRYYSVLYLTGTGVLTAGVVTFEEAPAIDAPDAAWTTVGTPVNATAISAGVTAVTRLTGAYAFVRARVSTALTGGGTIAGVVCGVP